MKNWLNKYKDGGIIEDDRGQLDHPGEITKINSNQITMKGVPYPVLGISDTGDEQMMYPEEEYQFDGNSVTEYPMAQNGKVMKKINPKDDGIIESEDNKTYGTYQLPEVTIKGKAKPKSFLEQSISQYLNENKDAGFFGALASLITYPLGLPQQAMMYATTGKVQRPSEGMDIENPYGAMAVDMIADPTNLVGAGVLTKEKALKALLASKETGLLSNAYKLNPFAFKPNSEMGYRMLGKEGFDDALQSGVLRAKSIPNATSEGINLSRNTNRNPNTGKMQPALDRPYFADGIIDERYASDYMAAVNKAENNLVQIPTHKGIAPINPGNISLENATLYKKDWLQGYKQIDVPKSNFKSEINWGNFNKEIPDNPTLIKEYNTIEQTTKANGSWMKNANGSEFNGTPEQFVQQQSSNFKKAYPEGYEITYRGGDVNPELNTKYTKNTNSVFTTKDDFGALVYNRMGETKPPLPTDRPDEGFLKLAMPKTENKIVIDGADNYISNGRKIYGSRNNYARLNVIDQPAQKTVAQQENLDKFVNWMRKEHPEYDLEDRVMTDHFAEYLNTTEGKKLDRVEFKKIYDGTLQPIDVEVHNLHNKKQLKSLWGNNGDFDMTNPNIYKSVLPIGLGLGAAAKISNEKKNGGWLSKYK